MKISIIVIVNKKAHSQNEQLVKAVRDIQSVQYILPFLKSSASGPASRNFFEVFFSIER